MKKISKKQAKVKKSKRLKQSFESISHCTRSQRFHFVLGLLICFFTLYTGIAILSYFFTGELDQDMVRHLDASQILSQKDLAVSNWAGVRGAIAAHIIINRWFGVPSLFLLFLLASIGFKLMHVSRINLFRRFLVCSVLTVWCSILLASVYKLVSDPFFNPGGLHGEAMRDWLVGNIGYSGLIILLVAGLLLILVFISSRTVPYLQSALTFGNNGERQPKPIKKPVEKDEKDGKVEDEEEIEDDEDDDEAKREAEAKAKAEGKVEEKEEEKTYYKPKKPISVDDEFIVTVGKDDDDDEGYGDSTLGEYDPRLDLSSYRIPDVGHLKKYEQTDNQVDMEEQNDNKSRIEKTLQDFGINIQSIKATVGPTITLYEVVPDKGVRISKIKGLEDDIALSLSALGIRIIAPMPGKGTIGLEVPNKNPQMVSMESVISSSKFIASKHELPIALGRTITNEIFIFDLTKTPHLLVAGATGQGKSVGLNAIITSLVYKKHPAELKFVLVDPKMVEFNIYEDIERHYLAKLPGLDHSIITDFSQVIDTLKSLCKEMDDRYDLLMMAKVRNVAEYNARFKDRKLNPEKGHKYMPYIVVIIDEFGDLIMTAGKEIEMPIARIAQKARAVGIHMIIATQRPSANIITGTIKANFPTRIAFKVSSLLESRIILDAAGANKLVGRGDLLYSQGGEPTRVQCAFVSTEEVESVVEAIHVQPGYETPYKLPFVFDESKDGGTGAIDMSSRDSLFEDAARLIVLQQQGSTSLIQRKFSIGYNRAGRLMDQLHKAGIVSDLDGSKGRQVLVPDEMSLDILLSKFQS